MILNLAKRRKTVRKFKKEKPPIEKILKSIEAAKEAPSGMNAQPWHFIIIETSERKRDSRPLRGGRKEILRKDERKTWRMVVR